MSSLDGKPGYFHSPSPTLLLHLKHIQLGFLFWWWENVKPTKIPFFSSLSRAEREAAGSPQKWVMIFSKDADKSQKGFSLECFVAPWPAAPPNLLPGVTTLKGLLFHPAPGQHGQRSGATRLVPKGLERLRPTCFKQPPHSCQDGEPLAPCRYLPSPLLALPTGVAALARGRPRRGHSCPCGRQPCISGAGDVTRWAAVKEGPGGGWGRLGGLCHALPPCAPPQHQPPGPP